MTDHGPFSNARMCVGVSTYANEQGVITGILATCNDGSTWLSDERWPVQWHEGEPIPGSKRAEELIARPELRGR